ncbi:MAG TPA: CHASE3 domain-containing protein, partial [Saprospiraceae bacterium]|nr:CHASE3 domain-containing protein [Saprospiraceae bacterium]
MKITTKILLAFVFILTLSILDTLSNYYLSVKVEDNARFLNNSQEIIRKSGQFQRTILEMQSSFRGFLLTQDTLFLKGYQSGLLSSPRLISNLQFLVKNDPVQLSLLNSIVSLQNSWISYSQQMIHSKLLEMQNLSGSNFSTLFDNHFRKYVGTNIYQELTSEFIELNDVEYGQRETHAANLAKSIQRTHFFSWTFFALTIFIGILTTVLVIKSINRRIRSMVSLAEKISMGNFASIRDSSHDELSSLANSMNVMSANLEKSMAQLESRNVELDKFSYVVSHDLKAPLRGIYNVIKWIQEDIGHELSPKMNEYLEIISNRTVRMEKLINGLLEYAKLRTQTKTEPTDVHNLVSDLVTELIPKAYTVELNHLPAIMTERLKLEQVFSNLISNAVKFT